jgi:hypothetical protein
VASFAERRHDAVPIPLVAADAGNQHVARHPGGCTGICAAIVDQLGSGTWRSSGWTTSASLSTTSRRVIEFFVELGLELEGEATVEGRGMNRMVGSTVSEATSRCCGPRTATAGSS